MGTYLLPVVPAVPTFFRRFSDDFTASPFLGAAAPAFPLILRMFWAFGHELLSRMVHAFLCCKLQEAVGGSWIPTPVCSCRDEWGRGTESVCARVGVLSSSLKPSLGVSC